MSREQHTARGRHAPSVQQRSEALKERVYVTFTALAVTISQERDPVHATAAEASATLLLTVVGTLLAVFVADVVAHMVRAGSLPAGEHLRHLVYVSFGSLSVVVAPTAVLGASALGVIEVTTALRLVAMVLALTLVAVTLLAVRRLRVGVGRKAVALVGVAALGLAAIGIELAVH